MYVINEFTLKTTVLKLKSKKVVHIHKIKQYQNGEFDGIIVFKYKGNEYAAYINYRQRKGSEEEFIKKIEEKINSTKALIKDYVENKISKNKSFNRFGKEKFWEFIKNQLNTIAVAYGYNFDKEKMINNQSYEKMSEMLEKGVVNQKYYQD